MDYSDRYESVAPGVRRAVVDVQTREFGTAFASYVERTADRIREESDDPSIRRRALQWKADAIPAARAASFRLEPVAALVDCWLLAVQMRLFFTEGAGSKLFGPQQHLAVDAARELESMIAEVGRATFREPDSFAQDIESWARAHPVENLSFARDPVIYEFADDALGRSGVFEAVASLEDMASTMGRQLTAYAASTPKQARWQAELIQEEVADSEVVRRASADLTRLTDSIERFAATTEKWSELIHKEIATLIEAVREQRIAIVDAISHERVTIIETLQQERIATMDELRSERAIVLEAIRTERTRTVEEVRELTGKTMADIEQRLEQVVDHLMWRVAQLALAAVILILPLTWACSKLVRASRGKAPSRA